MIATSIRKVNTRLEAKTSATKLVPLERGQSMNIKNLQLGEMYRGSRIWLVDDADRKYWSGAFSFNIANEVKSTLFKDLGIENIWRYTKGEEIKVGIIDCSIIKSHKSILNSTISVRGDLYGEKCIHGTYMTAIMNGSNIRDGYIGLIPNSEIIFCAYRDEVNFTPREILNCLKQIEDADIINLSFSSNKKLFHLGESHDAVELANYISDLVINKKKLILAATGNKGSQTIYKYYPAAFKNILPVSGVKFIGDKFYIEKSANIWKSTFLAGPIINYFDLNPNSETDFLGRTSGTSVTCAVFSSIFALILSYYKHKNITWNSPQELIDSVTDFITIYKEDSEVTFNGQILNTQKLHSIFKP